MLMVTKRFSRTKNELLVSIFANSTAKFNNILQLNITKHKQRFHTTIEAKDETNSLKNFESSHRIYLADTA